MTAESRTSVVVAMFPLGAAALLLAYLMTDWRSSVSTAHFMAFAGLAMLSAAPLFRGYFSGEVDAFEPVYWVSALYLLYFGVDSFAYANHPQVVASLLLALAGVTSFQIGYYAVTRTATSYRGFRKGEGAGIGKACVIYLVGLAATLLAIATGNFFGQYKNTDAFLAAYLGFLTALRFIGFLLIPSSVLGRLGFRRTTLIALLLLLPEMLVALLTTSKQLLVYPLLGLIMMRHYLVKRVRPLFFLVLAIALAPVFSLLYAVRGFWFLYIPSQAVTFGDLGRFLRDIPGQAFSLDWQSWLALLDNSLRRFHGTFSLLKILECSANQPAGYEAYHGIHYFFSILIPRFLWSGKPDANYQVFFGHTFAGVPSNLEVMIPPTQMGVFYLDYGLAGLIIGQVLVGAAAACLYSWFRSLLRSGRQWALALYVYYFIELLKIETNPFELLSAALKTFPLLLLVFWFVQKRRRDRLPATAGARPARPGTIPRGRPVLSQALLSQKGNTPA